MSRDQSFKKNREGVLIEIKDFKKRTVEYWRDGKLEMMRQMTDCDRQLDIEDYLRELEEETR